MPLAAIPAELWRRARRAPHRLLGLDYDGTLVPFRIERMQAALAPGAREALRRIAAGGRTTVAIVSGRPVAEIAALVPLPAVRLVGEHGWEMAMPGGGVRTHAPVPAARAALDRAWSEAVMHGWAERVERKRTGMVLHTRGLDAAEVPALRDACARVWGAYAAAGTLRLVTTDGGLELRAIGRDKGSAVRDLLAELPAGTLPVFVGDDVTDEDAFGAVQEIGFSVRVGRAVATSRADAFLASPAAVTEFLDEWVRQLETVPGDAAPPDAGVRAEGGEGT
jgi:trehalose 6-phosphate phosphatase